MVFRVFKLTFTGKTGLGQTEDHIYNVCECSGVFLNLQV